MRALILIGIGILLLAELDKLIEILKHSVFIIVIILFIFILIGIGTTELIKFKSKGWIGILNIFGVLSTILFVWFFLYYLFSLSFPLWIRSINSWHLSSILISSIIFAFNVFIRYERTHLDKLRPEHELDGSDAQINEAKSLVIDAEKALKNAFRQGIIVPQNTQQLLHYAQELLETHDLTNAREYALKCTENIESVMKEFGQKKTEQGRTERELELLRDEVFNLIKSAKFSLERTKILFVPALLNEERMLAKAQSFFDAKEYTNAKTAAQQCQNELERLLGEYKDSLEQINAAKLSLEKAKKLGIPNFEKEERMLAKAQSSFDTKEYTDAKTAAQNFRDIAENLIEKSKPNILLNLPQKLQHNIWKFQDIIITNNGTARAKNIILNFSKVFEIRELKNISQIDAGKQETLHINIKPTEAGDVPVDYIIKYSDLQDRTYEIKNSSTIQIGTLPDIKSTTEKRLLESDDLEITRGYEVLENKDLRFGILVKNISNYTINDVDVHLKCDRSLFSLKDREVISLSNITKNNPKTAIYFLTPLVGCVHYSKIRAIVSYKDASDNSLTVQMRPKEVHCISPFLAEKPMTEEQFSKLYESHSCHVDGIVFKGISADAVTNFIVDSAKNKRYVVKNSFINGTHIIYLSSVAKDKTFYLITVIIRSKNSQTHVGLRACSNNEGGINNFIIEILTSLRHYVTSDQSAREVENVINNISVQIINSEVHGGVSIGGDAFGRDESFNQGSRR